MNVSTTTLQEHLDQERGHRILLQHFCLLLLNAAGVEVSGKMTETDIRKVASQIQDWRKKAGG